MVQIVIKFIDSATVLVSPPPEYARSRCLRRPNPCRSWKWRTSRSPARSFGQQEGDPKFLIFTFLFITNDFGWDEFSDWVQGMSAFPNQSVHSSKPEAPSRATWLYEVYLLRKEIARQPCPVLSWSAKYALVFHLNNRTMQVPPEPRFKPPCLCLVLGSL